MLHNVTTLYPHGQKFLESLFCFYVDQTNIDFCTDSQSQSQNGNESYNFFSIFLMKHISILWNGGVSSRIGFRDC